VHTLLRPSWPSPAIDVFPDLLDMEKGDKPICLKRWLSETNLMRVSPSDWRCEQGPTLLDLVEEWNFLDISIELKSLRQVSVAIMKRFSADEILQSPPRIPGLVDFWGALHELHDIEARPNHITYERVLWGLLKYVPITSDNESYTTPSILQCPRQPEEDWLGNSNDLAGGRLWSLSGVDFKEPDSFEGAQVVLRSYFESSLEIKI